MNEIKVLVKKPGEFPVLMTIKNTLEKLQWIVDGYIEAVSLTRYLVVICDEEGRLKGKEHCCNISGTDFVGTIIIAGIDGDDFGDLPVTYHDMRQILPGLWRDIK